jgi:alkylhydroperoxidase family enzyme
MTAGARITDAVNHFAKRGNFRSAVRLVRTRTPERLRWRAAVGTLTLDAGKLLGADRMRLEEPIRELVLDLSDAFLQREIVLDARLHRVDLDRGEVLPRWTLGDLRRLSFLARTEVDLMRRYVALPNDFEAAIDTAAVVLTGRAFANMFRQRAERLWLSVPDQDGPEPLRLHQRFILERADLEAERSKRWAALAKTLTMRPT